MAPALIAPKTHDCSRGCYNVFVSSRLCFLPCPVTHARAYERHCVRARRCISFGPMLYALLRDTSVQGHNHHPPSRPFPPPKQPFVFPLFCILARAIRHVYTPQKLNSGMYIIQELAKYFGEISTLLINRNKIRDKSSLIYTR